MVILTQFIYSHNLEESTIPYLNKPWALHCILINLYFFSSQLSCENLDVIAYQNILRNGPPIPVISPNSVVPKIMLNTLEKYNEAWHRLPTGDKLAEPIQDHLAAEWVHYRKALDKNEGDKSIDWFIENSPQLIAATLRSKKLPGVKSCYRCSA